MFLQVKVKEEYLDALCFIWRDSYQDEISDYVMLSHLFEFIDLIELVFKSRRPFNWSQLFKIYNQF